ncbi:hypothetical protein SAMN05444157_3494 [Frankineae bacterium MT45]|nr:hypothetical protein SAMN05444157_3494 [Frankineae bacterium MT45]
MADIALVIHDDPEIDGAAIRWASEWADRHLGSLLVFRADATPASRPEVAEVERVGALICPGLPVRAGADLFDTGAPTPVVIGGHAPALGRVVDDLAQAAAHCSAPLILVPPGSHPAPADAPVLLAASTSRSGRAGLAFAVREAIGEQRPLHVVRVWQDPDWIFSMTRAQTAALEEARARDAAVLADVLARARALRPLLAVSGELVAGGLHERFRSLASSAALLVVGAGADHRVAAALAGEVACPLAIALAREAGCPTSSAIGSAPEVACHEEVCV